MSKFTKDICVRFQEWQLVAWSHVWMWHWGLEGLSCKRTGLRMVACACQFQSPSTFLQPLPGRAAGGSAIPHATCSVRGTCSSLRSQPPKGPVPGSFATHAAQLASVSLGLTVASAATSPVFSPRSEPEIVLFGNNVGSSTVLHQ